MNSPVIERENITEKIIWNLKANLGPTAPSMTFLQLKSEGEEMLQVELEVSNFRSFPQSLCI